MSHTRLSTSSGSASTQLANKIYLSVFERVKAREKLSFVLREFCAFQIENESFSRIEIKRNDSIIALAKRERVEQENIPLDEWKFAAFSAIEKK